MNDEELARGGLALAAEWRRLTASLAAAQYRVAALELALREAIDWMECEFPFDHQALAEARQALASPPPHDGEGSERREGEPRCPECGGAGEYRNDRVGMVECPACAPPAAPKAPERGATGEDAWEEGLDAEPDRRPCPCACVTHPSGKCDCPCQRHPIDCDMDEDCSCPPSK